MSIGFIQSNDNFVHEPTELAALRDAYLALFKDVHRYAVALEVLAPHRCSAEQEIAQVVLALSAAETGHDRLDTLLAEVDRLKRACAAAKGQSIASNQRPSTPAWRALLGGGLFSALLFGFGIAIGVIMAHGGVL
jgi:hypothetical protein